MNYIDFRGFLRFLGQVAGTPCGGLWSPSPAAYILLCSMNLSLKPLSSRLGLMSWLVDLAGLD